MLNQEFIKTFQMSEKVFKHRTLRNIFNILNSDFYMFTTPDKPIHAEDNEVQVYVVTSNKSEAIAPVSNIKLKLIKDNCTIDLNSIDRCLQVLERLTVEDVESICSNLILVLKEMQIHMEGF